jgi:ParB family chromosome partitioning protein
LRSSAKNVELTPYDELFTTQQERDDLQREKIQNIPILKIDDFPEHPFKVRDDESMAKLVDSISENGVMTPVTVRRKEDGRYELLSGHRRKHACNCCCIKEIPAIVKELSRDEGIIYMVDSNLQREEIMPSEKAFSYKMKLDAMKRQGQRTDLTSVPLAQKSGKTSREIVADEAGESADQVRRYIRLTMLIPEILDMVDNKQIGFRPAVELSYLREPEQQDLLETMQSEDRTPSLSQAIQMKQLSLSRDLDMEKIFSIMSEDKGNQQPTLRIRENRMAQFWPSDYSAKQKEDLLVSLLEKWYKQQRDKGAR